ncbi:DUF1223 domain-containing protein [Rhodovulum sulfidophilum]|uniref:DUF1223 domain-containing protein n=1 Tax=Rhodovulum sulfidophilum TaxID=35806 RepID=UPI00192668DC|nr:DUF1223 domain-containing protein [Rhodovulum sulfidophilum]MBL3586357.1 DUF1223 domain-containing protein [Rhodovulum sulfidophilum]
MRAVLTVLLAGSVFFAGPARSDPSPVVVELFTSQGCSACPPADALIAELAKRDDVIALALHVDYWDYIGWKDIFADPAFTRRQKAYAHAAGKRSIYTPQMVVEGADHVVGYRPMDLAQLIEAHALADSHVELGLARQGDMVTVTAVSAEPFGEDVVLQIVRYRPEQQVDIKRGENAGKSLRYANIVEAWTPVARWNGAEPLSVSVQAAGEEPIVAILQRPGPGAILAAARLR